MTFQAGQFDDAAEPGAVSELFDSLIEETMKSENGVLVFDYEVLPSQQGSRATSAQPSLHHYSTPICLTAF